MLSELFVKMTDILQAIFNCDLRKLKVFLSDNEKVNREIPGTEGCSPLHLLVGVENVTEKDQVLSYLLEIGADPNARSYDDLTPVHIAAMWNNCPELEKLLQSGGNPWLTDNENKNAFDLAINNHAYEAYQLLHKYLSEDKLNFRVRVPPPITTPSYCKQNSTLNTGMTKDTNLYSRYFSAHENLPLYFSSSDESAESFLNVSRILKKDLTSTRMAERKNYSRLDPEKMSSNKGLLSDICSNKYLSDCTEVPKEKVCNFEIISDSFSFKRPSDNNEVPKQKVCNSVFMTDSLSNKYSSDHSEVNENDICNYGFLSDICSNKYSSDNSEVPKDQVCDSEFMSDSFSNKLSSDQSEFNEEKVCKSGFLSDICPNKYSSDGSEVPEDKVGDFEVPSTSDETEIYSTSENEYVIQEESLEDNFETIIETDNKSGIALVQKSVSSVDYSSVKSCSMSDCDNYAANDWKSFHYSQNTSCILDKSCTSHTNSVFIPPDYRKLSNTTIFLQLKNLGDNPGPVSNSTREIYLRRLTSLKSGCNTSCILPNPKYCNEVYMFLEGKFNGDRIQNLMNTMSDEFDSVNPKQNWREGNQRCCFNYFLLDPRVTQNLPLRLKQLPYEKAFLTFLDALFYVGKGMRARPYSHLLEAAKAAKDLQWKSDKVAHIRDIWESGHGVISLHCFNNCIPVEAYTQEACIIDAVGLENLTNIINGNYYGVAAKWKWSWKRQIGVELLHRALQIFILEGEKQILPKDIRKK